MSQVRSLHLLTALVFVAIGCSKADQCKMNLRHDCNESDSTYYKSPPPAQPEEPKKVETPSFYAPEIAVALEEELRRELFYDCRNTLAKTETNRISISRSQIKINSHREFPFDRATYSSSRTGEITSVLGFESGGDVLKTVNVGVERVATDKDPTHIRVMPGDNVIKYRLETCRQLDKTPKEPVCIDWKLEEESQVKLVVTLKSSIKGVCERRPKCFLDKVVKYRECVPVTGSTPTPVPNPE